MVTFALDSNLIIVGNHHLVRNERLGSRSTIVHAGIFISDDRIARVTDFLVEDVLAPEPADYNDVLTALQFEHDTQVWIHKLVVQGYAPRYYRVISTPDAIYASLISPSQRLEGLTSDRFVVNSELPAYMRHSDVFVQEV